MSGKVYDVAILEKSIWLLDPDGGAPNTKIPPIDATRALATGDYDRPHIERDISRHFKNYGYSIHGILARDTIAIPVD